MYTHKIRMDMAQQILKYITKYNIFSFISLENSNGKKFFISLNAYKLEQNYTAQFLYNVTIALLV